MTVSLNRPYGGYASGAIATFDAATESSLIAQQLAVASTPASTTTGAISTTANHGKVACPIGVSSVIINNPNISPNSVCLATVAQAAADGTALRVERTVCGAGLATVYLTANATAVTLVDFVLFNIPGAFTN